jgi:oligopeptide transport system substrate-binding protein
VVFEGWTYAMPDPRDMLEQGVTRDPNNDSQASSPEYDAAFAATDRTADESRRREAFDRMEAINARECFYAPIYYTNQSFLVHPSVRGWHDNAVDIVEWRGIHLEP